MIDGCPLKEASDSLRKPHDHLLLNSTHAFVLFTTLSHHAAALVFQCILIFGQDFELSSGYSILEVRTNPTLALMAQKRNLP